jgi:chromate transporter
MGLISPGPVVIMATFAGHLVYGMRGALIATAVFIAVYLFVIVPGPLLRRHDQLRLERFIMGATAAAARAMPGAAIVIGQRVITAASSVVIALVALALLLQPRFKVPEPAVVVAAALTGAVALR